MHGQRGVKNRKCMMYGNYPFSWIYKSLYLSGQHLDVSALNIHLKHSEICFGSLFLQLNRRDWKWLCFINRIKFLLHLPELIPAGLILDWTSPLIFSFFCPSEVKKWTCRQTYSTLQDIPGLVDNRNNCSRGDWTVRWHSSPTKPFTVSLNLACMFHYGGSWATTLHWMGLAWTLQTIAFASVPSPIKPVSNMLFILWP